MTNTWGKFITNNNNCVPSKLNFRKRVATFEAYIFPSIKWSRERHIKRNRNNNYNSLAADKKKADKLISGGSHSENLFALGTIYYYMLLHCNI